MGVGKKTFFKKVSSPQNNFASLCFTFAARRKTSHCGAMLHAGKNSRHFTLIIAYRLVTLHQPGKAPSAT